MDFDCTVEFCGLDWSYWGYVPSLPINAAFTAVFAISMVSYLIQGALCKRWLGFTIAMICGCALEVVGYIGRMLAHNDIFSESFFLMQIICITIAPAFLAAGIYLCLSRIVLTFGAENSRIKPGFYPRIFIPCDIFSLMLQAGGGGYASIRTHQNQDPTTGNNVMILGLSVQVFTLVIFILLAIDFAVRTYRRISRLGSRQALDPRHAKLRESVAFKGFVVALFLSTLCIFTRCVYRVAELGQGWRGELFQTQKYFIGFEGAIIIASVTALNIFHPGFSLNSKESLRATGERWAEHPSSVEILEHRREGAEE